MSCRQAGFAGSYPAARHAAGVPCRKAGFAGRYPAEQGRCAPRSRWLPGPPTGLSLFQAKSHADLTFRLRPPCFSENAATAAVKPVPSPSAEGPTDGGACHAPLELRVLFGSSRVREDLPRRDSLPPAGVASPSAPLDSAFRTKSTRRHSSVDGSETSVSSRREGQRTNSAYVDPAPVATNISSAQTES